MFTFKSLLSAAKFYNFYHIFLFIFMMFSINDIYDLFKRRKLFSTYEDSFLDTSAPIPQSREYKVIAKYNWGMLRPKI